MREILKRAVTGILYALLLLAAVFLSDNSDAFDFLFLAFGIICLYEFKRLVKLSGYYIFIAFLVLWWLFVYLITDLDHFWPLLFLSLTVDLYLAFSLFVPKKAYYSNIAKFLIALFYIGGGFISMTKLPYIEGQFNKIIIIGVFVLIWTNDTFAYLIGKSIGRTRPMRRISPKKTIEGWIGGLVFSIGAAYLLSLYSEDLRQNQWFYLGAVVVVAGSLGDLVESKFKRDAGVKDSGAILPGHGGLLDRLDSLVYASPFIYVALQSFDHVP